MISLPERHRQTDDLAKLAWHNRALRAVRPAITATAELLFSGVKRPGILNFKSTDVEGS